MTLHTLHVADEMLLGGALDADASTHVAGCEACRVRAQRLQAGAMLIESVRRESMPPDIDWRSVDARIMAAAESTARDIRSGKLRPARRGVTVGYVGMALAVAASAVFLLRSPASNPGPHDGTPVAVRTPGPALSSGGEHPSSAVASVTSVEGVVLLVASPVAYVGAPGAMATALTASTVVQSGGRVATDDHGGRAVLALDRGYRVDVRPGAELTFASLTTVDTRMVLTKGEARVDGPALADDGARRVTVEAAGWMLHAKGGGFVAKLESGMVRLRVMSGKVGVSRSGVTERDVNAGDEIELAQDGVGFRVVGHGATDPSEIDVAYLSRDGQAVTVPTLPARSTLRVEGRTAGLPPNVVGLRPGAPVTVQAQVGSETWSLALDPHAGAPSEWRRPVHGTAIVQGHVVASAADPGAAGSTFGGASAGVPSPSAVPVSPPVLDPAESAMTAHERLEQQLATRAGVCFAQCRQTNNCGLAGASSGDVAIDPDGDGHVVAVRVTGFSATDLNACIAREARVLSIPSYVIGTVQLHLVAPR